MSYYVYFVASKSGTLYIGVTNNLGRRVKEYKEGLVEGFSKKYRCNLLIYVEEYVDVREAILREKQLKKWNRKKKEWLIGTQNPSWRDLALEL